MQAETRKEIWSVIQAIGALYCCVIGTWAILHPPGAQTSAQSNTTPWWYIVLLIGFGVCAATLTAGVVASIVQRRREKTTPKPAKSGKTNGGDVERERLQQENKKLEAERDRFKQDHDILWNKFQTLNQQFNQQVFQLGEYKKEADELYAEMIFVWLKDHIHTTATFSAESLSQSLGLPEIAVRRGLGLLHTDYGVVKQQFPNMNAWMYVAAATSLKPKYKIVPAVETDRERVFNLAFRLRGFLKELGPRPDFDKPEGMEQLDYVKALAEQVSPWLTKLIAGYQGRFADDVQKARHLLAEHNIVDFELDGLIQGAKDETSILKIARKLTAMAAELDEET